MTDIVLAELIIFGSAGAMYCIGIGLSAWKGEFSPNHNDCDGSCCDPDHWSIKERAKLTSEQYKTMKNNIELFERTKRV